MIVAVVVAIAVVFFMIISPGFRRVAIVSAVLGGFGLWWIIRYSTQETQQYERQRVEAERISTTLIKQSDLALTDVKLEKEYSWWALKGTVTNNSRYALSSMTFEVTIMDCPNAIASVTSTQEKESCRTVGQQTGEAHAVVPAGQTRTFSTYALEFKNMPAPANPSERRTQWKIAEIHAAQ
jgi:hypothetical protein